jgi:hypothetical protein
MLKIAATFYCRIFRVNLTNELNKRLESPAIRLAEC